MALKRLPAVLADGGEMTVVRRLVNFVWGSWQVTWPKDFEPPQLDEGRVLGYVGALAEPDPGLSARRFARADVEIVARDEHVTPVEPGASNVEEIFDETMRRASGEVFFEKDFPTKSLGRLVPFVDFQLGDRIPVRLWGRVLPGQLVTSIREVSTPEEPRGWLVHTGGQVLGDDVERIRQTRAIERQIAQERRERSAGVRGAVQAAGAARSVAEAARSDAALVREQMDALAGRVVSLEAADGSTNFYGPEDPTRQGKKPAVGDTWFRSDSEGAISIWAWNGKRWVEAVPEVDFTEVDERLEAARRDVDAAAEAVRAAEKDIELMRRELTKKVDASAYREAMAQHEAKQKQLQTDLTGLDTELEEADRLVRQDVGSGRLLAGGVKDGVITTPKLAANAVVAGKIAANAVTSGTIAANAITAREIKGGEVTTAHLSADAVTADKIAADSITARHIVVPQPGNLIANGELTQGKAGWDPSLVLTRDEKHGPPNGWRLSIPRGQGTMQAHGPYAWFDVTPGAAYAFEIWLFGTNGTKFFLECRNQDDKHAGAAGGVVNEGDEPTGGGAYLVAGRELSQTWRRYSCVYTMGPNTTRARLSNWFFNHSSGETTDGVVYFGGVVLRPMADASLIVDGAVVADKLAANAVVAGKIAAGAVTSREILAGTITAREIKSGSLTSDDVVIKTAAIKEAMLADAAVTTAKIRDAAITSAKIAQLDAGKITSGTISAARIGAGTITAGKIAAGALTAREIKAEVFTQVSTSVLPLIPGETVGAWTAGADATGTATLGGETLRWWEFNKTAWPSYGNLVAVDASIEYDFSLWVFGSGSPRVYIELLDQDGQHAVESGGINNANPNAAQTGSSYLVTAVTVRNGWTKYQSRVRLKPGVRFVRVGGIYGNHAGASGTRFCIADMQLCPHVVQQREVDKAQDDAIKALEQQQAWQRTWNVERARIDSRQDREIKRLDSVQQVQDTLLGMMARPLGAVAGPAGNPTVDEDNYGRLEVSVLGVTFTAKSTWTGKVYILTQHEAINNYTKLTVADITSAGQTIDMHKGFFQTVNSAIAFYKKI